MAKKSKIAREKHLAKKVKRHYLLRKELRDLIKHPNTSSHVRLTNWCLVAGRPKVYMRKFGLSWITFRELALKGELPGVTKASW